MLYVVNFWPYGSALACLTEAVCCPKVSDVCNLQKLSLMNGINGFIHIYIHIYILLYKNGDL